MKKKILIPVIIIFVCILLFAGLSGGDNDTSTKEASKTENTEKSSDPSGIEAVSVDDPMNCPAFTAEKNSSDMDLQIYKTAKDYKDTLTDEQAAAIVNAIKEENPKFYDDRKKWRNFCGMAICSSVNTRIQTLGQSLEPIWYRQLNMFTEMSRPFWMIQPKKICDRLMKI